MMISIEKKELVIDANSNEKRLKEEKNELNRN